MKQLKELDVNHNKVRQFEPNSFEGKLPIKCLKIDDNGLKNFIHIQKLLRLQHLFANSNKITEFYDIEKLAELPYLKELELTGNILYRKPGYRATMIKKLPGLLYLDGRVFFDDNLGNNARGANRADVDDKPSAKQPATALRSEHGSNQPEPETDAGEVEFGKFRRGVYEQQIEHGKPDKSEPVQ
jgi:Leucine-rich repeat (LRR) protein